MIAILTLLAIGLVFAVCLMGLGSVLLAAEQAPEGYEDAAGFHLGAEPQSAGGDFLASLLTVGGDDLPDAGLPEDQTQRERPRLVWSPLGVRE
jgi:hypothetical protein